MKLIMYIGIIAAVGITMATTGFGMSVAIAQAKKDNMTMLSGNGTNMTMGAGNMTGGSNMTEESGNISGVGGTI